MMTALLFAVCALFAVGHSVQVGGENTRYPTGGTEFRGGVDVSITIDLGDDYIVFNGQQYHHLYLNTNGYVTFGNKYGKAPMPLDQWDAYNQQIIAAYWANSEPRCGGIFYRVLKKSAGDEPTTFAQADDDVMHANVPRMGTFSATSLVVISFVDVKPSGSLMNCANAPGITFQLILASDNTVSYAFFLYDSLNWDHSKNGQYAIAAIGSGGGLLNVIEEVSEVSGTSNVYELPTKPGNVVEGSTMINGFFIKDIDSLKNPALLAMRVSEMMAQLQMMMAVVQALPEKPINPYTPPARVQAANPYYPGYAFAQRAYMAGDPNARYQEAERPNVPYRYSD